MKSKRILVLMHQDLVPPPEAKLVPEDRLNTPWTTEYDVITELKKIGHHVYPLGVYSDLKKIRQSIDEIKPHVVFNLLEEFDGESLFDSYVVSYLELLRIPYTGCNPRGLMIARDKALTKKILSYHRLKTPKFFVSRKNRKLRKAPKNLSFPLIVKCLNEEASLGLAKASIVQNEEKLFKRVEYIHKKIGVDAIIEEFIPGREFYVGIMGNYKLEVLPVWEVSYNKVDKPEQEFYSRAAKWNEKYRKRKGIKSGKAKIDAELENKIYDIAKKTYKILDLNGYARIDVRVDDKDNIYVIEANPNPNISWDDEFSESAHYKNILKYPDVLEKIIKLGMNWHS